MKKRNLFALATLLMAFCLSIQATPLAKISKTYFQKLGSVYQLVEEASPGSFNSFMDLDGYSDDSAKAIYNYVFLDHLSNVYNLPDDPNLNQFLGKQVEITAYKTTNGLHDISIVDKSIPSSDAIDPIVVQGPYKVLVVKLRFNNAAETFTDTDARRSLFYHPKNANYFFQTASFRKLWLTGDRNPDGDVAYVNLNVNIAECNEKLRSDWTSLVNQSLQLQGYDITRYRGIISVFPNDSVNCPFAASAIVGTVGGTQTMRAWIPSLEYVTSPVDAIHETGHMLGFNHSSGIRCQDNVLFAINLCFFVEYGDRSDVMGSGSSFGLPNIYQRRRLGWYAQPYRQLDNNVTSLNLYSPSIENPPGTFRRLNWGQNFYLPLLSNLAGNSLYFQAGKTFLPFDVYTQNPNFLIFEQGAKLIIGPDDYQAYTSRPLILDTNPSVTLDDAALLRNSHKVGNVTITNNHAATIVSGTRVNLSFEN